MPHKFGTSGNECYTNTVCIRACLSCKYNIQVFHREDFMCPVLKIANVHPLSTQKCPEEVEEDTHLPQLSSGQNARRAHSQEYSPSIIDAPDKYQFAVLASSIRRSWFLL